MQSTQRYSATERILFTVADLEHDDLTDTPTPITQQQFRDGRITVVESAPHRFEYLGETPIAGEGAITRWLSLYNRAICLRTGLQVQDRVALRNVWRVVRSLFLYEHQLTAKTRRRARLALWHRDHSEAPTFVTRTEWARCRCWDCQPALWKEDNAPHSWLVRTA